MDQHQALAGIYELAFVDERPRYNAVEGRSDRSVFDIEHLAVAFQRNLRLLESQIVEQAFVDFDLLPVGYRFLQVGARCRQVRCSNLVALVSAAELGAGLVEPLL